MSCTSRCQCPGCAGRPAITLNWAVVGCSALEHCFLPYKHSSTDMEGPRKLRGMVVFPVEETARGYSCYSGDYAAHLAYTT